MTEYSHPIITELLPKPTTGSEWVELYNPTSTAIDLTDWTLTDQLSQPSLIYTFTAISIAPGDTLVVEVGKKLNDSGDGVTLLDATGQAIDETTYTSSAPADQSWSRLSRSSPDFGWSSSSPGVAPPLLITPTPTKLPSPTATLTSTPTPTSIPATSTPRPSARPSPSPSSGQIQITPTINPISTTTLQTHSATTSHSTSSPTKPWPSPQLTSLIATRSALDTTQSTASPAAAPRPSLPHSRQVYFPDWRSVPAIHNVIIGGLILAVYTGLLIWFDWQQSQLIEL